MEAGRERGSKVERERKEMRRDISTASVRTLNMYGFHYLSLLVDTCISINKYMDDISMAIL